MAEVVVVTSTLFARSSSSNVTGQVFLNVCGRFFPDAQWNDFPVIVLGWWLSGLTELACGASKTYEGSFMDGPYKFVVEAEAIQTARLTFHGQDEEWSKPIDFQAFHASTAQAAATVLQECKSRGWSNRDLIQLEAAVARAAA